MISPKLAAPLSSLAQRCFTCFDLCSNRESPTLFLALRPGMSVLGEGPRLESTGAVGGGKYESNENSAPELWEVRERLGELCLLTRPQNSDCGSLGQVTAPALPLGVVTRTGPGVLGEESSVWVRTLQSLSSRH